MTRLDDARTLGRQLRAAQRIMERDVAAKVKAGDFDDDEVAEVADLFADWAPDEPVVAGDIRRWDGTLVECIQGHTTQADWTPDAAPALWKIHRQAGTIAGWVQPAGGHDAYQLGDRVTYDGQTWESTAANNVWAPGVYGWVVI